MARWESQGMGEEASAKPKLQIRWFLILLLTLKPLTIALQGKGEAEPAAGESCPCPQPCPTHLGVYFPHLLSLFTHHLPGQRMLCIKQSPGRAASPQGGFTPLPGLTLPVSSTWYTRGALHSHTSWDARSTPVKLSGSWLCQPARNSLRLPSKA